MTSVSSMASLASGPPVGHVERLLAKHRDSILRELDLESVLPLLMDKGIFEEGEKHDILNESTNELRVNKFLEILSRKGIGSFHDFCSSLEKRHPHLLTSFLLDSCSPEFSSPSPTPLDDPSSQVGLEIALRERDMALREQAAMMRQRNEAQRRVEELRAERDSLAGVISSNFSKGSSVSPNLNRGPAPHLQVPPNGSMTNSRDSLFDSSANRSRSPNRRLLWDKLRALEAGAASFVSGGAGTDSVDAALQGIDVGERISWDVHSVTLTRVPPLGFGIAVSGGRDNPHFDDGDPSIAISDVIKAGPAETKLRINDRIVSVNGISLENVDHHSAIELLKDSGDTVNLVIKRKVVTPELVPVAVNLSRSKKKEDFGVVLGYQLYVREIVPNSVAAVDGSLHEGDVVVKINSTAADMLSLVEARKQIDKAKDRLSLSVLRMALPDHPASSARHSRNASQLSELGLLPEKDVNSKANTLTTPRGGGVGIGSPDEKPSNLDRRPPHNANLLNGFDSSSPVGAADGMDYPDAGSPDSCATSGFASANATSPATDLGSPILPPAQDDRKSPPAPKPKPSVSLVRTASMPASKSPVDEDYRPFVPRDPFPSGTVGRRKKNASAVASPEPLTRVVAFRKSGSGVGFRLAGGNKTGVFVSNVQPTSAAAMAGLTAGEKIVKANNVELVGLTREDALLLLLGLKERIELITQYRREEFDEIVTNSIGDSIFMRAHFDYKPNEGGEMSFVRGDVFHITNTLHNGVVGSWQAARVGRGNKETQRGIIPNKTRAEQIAAEARETALNAMSANITSGTASVGRRASWFRRRSKRSKSLGKDHWDDVIFSPIDAKETRPAYERVALKHPGLVRPIVLFGAVADVARHMLLRDAPHAFESPQVDAGGDAGEVKREEDDFNQVNTPKSGIIKIKQIRDIVEKDKHCLLDVTPAAVDRLNYAQLHPIAIFLRAETKHQVKSIRAHLAKGSRKSSRKLFETATKLESVYGHLFTATVSLAGDPTAWYLKLREVIDRQQRDPVWISESALDADDLNDEYLFPMGTRLSYASSPESDGEFAAAESRRGSIAEDEAGSPLLQPPHLLPPPPSEDVTPRGAGYVGDGATEEEKKKLRRSFSSPSVTDGNEEREKTPTPMTNIPTTNGFQPAFSNPLKEELEARLKRQNPEPSGQRGSIALGTSGRMRSLTQRDLDYLPKGVNAIATIRSTKKHGSPNEQIERNMSAMERLRPGVSPLPTKHVIKLPVSSGDLNEQNGGNSQHRGSFDSASEVNSNGQSPQGSTGGTPQKKESFKNHDPYRFTRSTAYPYNTDSIDRMRIKKSHKILDLPESPTSPRSPVESPYLLPSPPSPPPHPPPQPPPNRQREPPPPPVGNRERNTGGSLKVRPNVPPKPRGYSFKETRNQGPPPNPMSQSEYGRLPTIPHFNSDHPPLHHYRQSPTEPGYQTLTPSKDLNKQNQRHHELDHHPSHNLSQLEGRSRPNPQVQRSNSNLPSYPSSPSSSESQSHFAKNPYFPPPPAFSDHLPHHFPPPPLPHCDPSFSQPGPAYPSTSTPVSVATPFPPPQYPHPDAPSTHAPKRAPRQPPPPPPPKSALRSHTSHSTVNLSESPYAAGKRGDGPYAPPNPYRTGPGPGPTFNNLGASYETNLDAVTTPPATATQAPHYASRSSLANSVNPYGSGIMRIDSGYGSSDRRIASYQNLAGSSQYLNPSSVSTFAAYGTKASGDGIEDPYGRNPRSLGDGVSETTAVDSQIVATARGIFDYRGGTLESEETGVSILIPPGSIPENRNQEIYFKVCSRGRPIPSLPTIERQNGETLLSPLVMCGPQGLTFNKPVELRLPHCASVTPEGGWSFSLRAAQSPNDEPSRWHHLRNFTHLGRDSVSVLVDHF